MPRLYDLVVRWRHEQIRVGLIEAYVFDRKDLRAAARLESHRDQIDIELWREPELLQCGLGLGIDGEDFPRAQRLNILDRLSAEVFRLIVPKEFLPTTAVSTGPLATSRLYTETRQRCVLGSQL